MYLQGPESSYYFMERNNIIVNLFSYSLHFSIACLAGFYISWRNQNIHVYRPDVECINGIIHVIDSVFLTEADIQVNGAPRALSPVTTLLATGALLFLAATRLLQ